MLASTSIVFIVNADQDCRKTLERVAAAAGSQVFAFASAAAYLAHAKPDLPACHVLDVNLPDMSGLDLQALVPASEAVIFVTRQADVLSSARAFKGGAIDFLALPLDEAELLRAIRTGIEYADARRAEQQRVAALRRRHDSLTTREREVLQLVVSGCMNKQVGSELGICEITVKAHRGRVMAKMLATSFADLVRMATLLDVPLLDGRHGARNPAPAASERPAAGRGRFPAWLAGSAYTPGRAAA